MKTAFTHWNNDYKQKRKERLTAATRNDTNETRTNGATIARKQKWEGKQLYGHSKRQASVISNEKTWTWLRKGNLTRKTEVLLIAAQNNAISTNYIKTIIDQTQQNISCRLYGDRDETINHILSECSKLGQKEYQTRHDWVGKVIHWEWYKKFKFVYTNKWYMHNPEHESDDYTNCNWCSWYSHQRIGTKTGRLGKNRTGEHSPNNSNIQIGQNTEKSLGDFRKLTVTQTPVENHSITLMWKIRKV